MEINFDEQILLTQKVDENSEQPVINQILRIAVYDEFKAYEAYTKIIEQFGYVQPFVSIKEAEAMHYAALVTLMQKYNVPVPVNDWADKIEVPKTLIECCELGVASEINNIAMYDYLLLYAKEDDVRDILFKLQAASYNNHLPAFRRCVLEHYSGAQSAQAGFSFNQDEMMEKFGEYQMLLEDIMAGNVDQDKLTQIFSKLNISMVSGAAFGSAAVAFLNTYMNKKNQEE